MLPASSGVFWYLVVPQAMSARAAASGRIPHALRMSEHDPQRFCRLSVRDRTFPEWWCVVASGQKDAVEIGRQSQFCVCLANDIAVGKNVAPIRWVELD